MCILRSTVLVVYYGKVSVYFWWSCFVIKCVLLSASVELALIDITRSNMISIQGKGPDDKWTRKPFSHLRVTRPSELCVNLIFKHIHTASIYTICIL